MIMVKDGLGQTESLTNIQGFDMVKEVNGAFKVSFTSIFDQNNAGYDLLKEESIIEIDGYTFRVKQFKETNNRKNITANSTFFDLKGKRQEVIFAGTRTLEEFIGFTLQNTGVTFENRDVTESKLIPNFGIGDVLDLIQTICIAFECEYDIQPGDHVIFAKQIGGEYDAQYRYGHNVQTLSKNVDTTNLRTRIKGTGGNGLEVVYTSPNHATFGIIDAEPIVNEQITESDSMTEHLKQQITDYPEATFEFDTAELTEKELGERVWLIYEPMNLEFMTRVLSKTSGLRNYRLYTKSVVLGNKMPKTLTDVLVSQKVEINRNIKETRSRFHQTNERISQEVEQIDVSIAAIVVQAHDINMSVSNIMGRVAGTEASINIQAGQISQTVKQVDFNGNAIVSMINQTPLAVNIEASKINLVGLVTVSSLNTPGAVTIHEGNVVGSSFTVGRGTGNPNLSMYATQGSHRITSSDGAGFRIESQANLSFAAGNGLTIYALSKLWAQSNFQVTGFSQLQGLYADSISLAGSSVSTAATVQTQIGAATANLVSLPYYNSGLAQLERDLVAWANGKFATK